MCHFWPLQTLEPGAYPGFTSLSPPEQTTPVQPRNPELEQRAKAMRGRMWVLPLLHQLPPFITSTLMSYLSSCSGLFSMSWFRRRKIMSKISALWWRWETIMHHQENKCDYRQLVMGGDHGVLSSNKLYNQWTLIKDQINELWSRIESKIKIWMENIETIYCK